MERLFGWEHYKPNLVWEDKDKPLLNEKILS